MHGAADLEGGVGVAPQRLACVQGPSRSGPDIGAGSGAVGCRRLASTGAAPLRHLLRLGDATVVGDARAAMARGRRDRACRAECSRRRAAPACCNDPTSDVRHAESSNSRARASSALSGLKERHRDDAELRRARADRIRGHRRRSPRRELVGVVAGGVGWRGGAAPRLGRTRADLAADEGGWSASTGAVPGQPPCDAGTRSGGLAALVMATYSRRYCLRRCRARARNSLASSKPVVRRRATAAQLRVDRPRPTAPPALVARAPPAPLEAGQHHDRELESFRSVDRQHAHGVVVGVGRAHTAGCAGPPSLCSSAHARKDRSDPPTVSSKSRAWSKSQRSRCQ